MNKCSACQLAIILILPVQAACSELLVNPKNGCLLLCFSDIYTNVLVTRKSGISALDNAHWGEHETIFHLMVLLLLPAVSYSKHDDAFLVCKEWELPE